MRKGLFTWVFWAKIPFGDWKGFVIDEWGSYPFLCVTPITVWVESKNESNCLSENKMLSTLIWRHVSLLYVVQSNILWRTILLSYHYRCNIVFTNYRFPVSFLLHIVTQTLTKSLLWTVLRILLSPKKITLARFACLCSFKVSVLKLRRRTHSHNLWLLLVLL